MNLKKVFTLCHEECIGNVHWVVDAESNRHDNIGHSDEVQLHVPEMYEANWVDDCNDNATNCHDGDHNVGKKDEGNDKHTCKG